MISSRVSIAIDTIGDIINGSRSSLRELLPRVSNVIGGMDAIDAIAAITGTFESIVSSCLEFR